MPEQQQSQSTEAQAIATSIQPSLLQSTALGGTAAMFAVNFTHPIELVKTRVQVSQDGLLRTCTSTLRNEGVTAFWKGIPWAYCREGSYTAIRLGAYAPVRDAIGAGSQLSLVHEVLCWSPYWSRRIRCRVSDDDVE